MRKRIPVRRHEDAGGVTTQSFALASTLSARRSDSKLEPFPLTCMPEQYSFSATLQFPIASPCILNISFSSTPPGAKYAWTGCHLTMSESCSNRSVSTSSDAPTCSSMRGISRCMRSNGAAKGDLDGTYVKEIESTHEEKLPAKGNLAIGPRETPHSLLAVAAKLHEGRVVLTTACKNRTETQTMN